MKGLSSSFNYQYAKLLLMKKYLAGFMFFSTVLFSCKQTADKTVIEDPVTIAVGTINTDSIASPVVTPVTGANAPRIIPAPTPKVIPLKYPFGVGQPSIVNYSVADGLPQNLILSMTMDKKGNIWAGGLGFVSKYDGSRFTNYYAKNGIGTSSDGTSCMVIDTNNNVWVAKYDGLYRFDGQAFLTTPLSNYDNNINIRKLGVDKQGAIWVGTGKGVFRIMGDSMTHFGEKEGLPKQPFIQTMLFDHNDRLLVSIREGIYQLQGNSFVPYSKTPSIEDKMQGLVGKDSHDNLWVTRRNPTDDYRILIRYHGDDSMVYSVKEGFDVKSSVNNLIEAKDGITWIATNANGLIRFDGKRFISYTTSDGLPANRITGLLEDDYGNIWVSTPEGISRLSYQFMNRLENQTKGEAFRNYFAIGPDGTRWLFDGNSNSLIKYRKEDALVYNLGEVNKMRNAIRIFIDRSGQVWLAYWNTNTIIRFNNKDFFIYSKEQGVTLDFFSTTSEDKEGNIWFSGGGGVLKFDGKTMKHYGTAQGFPKVADAFYADKNGSYWITGDSSLLKFDGKQVTSYTYKDGYFGEYVYQIAEDSLGNIWLAGSSGAIRFNGRQFTNYNKVEGLNSMLMNVTVDTARRMLWFSSRTGLSTVNFDQINSSNPIVRQYDQLKGFDVIPNHTGNENTFFDSLGIWGNGYTGVYRFDYDKVRQFKEPLLQISNIRVDNQQVVWSKLLRGKQKPNDSLTILNESVLKFENPLDNKQNQEQQAEFGNLRFDSLQKGNLIPGNLKLPYKNNSITFEFTAVSPSFGKYTQYRYKLERYQDNWSPFSTKDEAFFGNMSEGRYTFYLQAISTTGTQTELSYSFRVLPPWYRTWWAYVLYVLLLGSGIFLFVRWRTKALQKEKIHLEEKVAIRTAELNQSLENLKATQSQLIQSEKMASLGELTAGIAHEIQNPLNFVNNFSGVSAELVKEMVEEVDKGNTEEVKAIADDVVQNLEKINHHGNRAADIVKGMLQHSRNSNGTKEPADINALCDEYLRLSYHGLRAKDKSFNATMKTDFDESIGNINIIPQDIGRVVLNLINNAFYAVDEKKKQIGNGYEPTVSVSTKKNNGKVEIKVADNGNGIPQKVLDKIFQPFFTTKPTGQGTGLGLSLSYDIVKAHGGEIKVNTKENEGTEFIIQLPIN